MIFTELCGHHHDLILVHFCTKRNLTFTVRIRAWALAALTDSLCWTTQPQTGPCTGYSERWGKEGQCGYTGESNKEVR